jgi:dTDP-4-dehydrorhamnose 3,5-epimerase
MDWFGVIMRFNSTAIPDVIVIEPLVNQDQRGFFMEIYQRQKYRKAGISLEFVQSNHAGSAQGVLRGLHYQIRQPQGKLVRVVHGKIYDVAVDLRRSSATFGQWAGIELSAENRLMLWVPPRFAHGYYVMSDRTEITYYVTDFYAPEWERTLAWNDPSVGINWPIQEDVPPTLSDKDSNGLLLDHAEVYE